MSTAVMEHAKSTAQRHIEAGMGRSKKKKKLAVAHLVESWLVGELDAELGEAGLDAVVAAVQLVVAVKAPVQHRRSMSAYRERRSQLHRVFLTPASEKTPGTAGTWQQTRWSISESNGEIFVATFSDLPNLGPRLIFLPLHLCLYYGRPHRSIQDGGRHLTLGFTKSQGLKSRAIEFSGRLTKTL